MTRVSTWLVAPLVLAGCAVDADVGRERRPVINGEPTPAGLYPATGALMLSGQPSCTGTLIAPDVVLTAAHCVDDLFGGGEIPGFTLALDANTAAPGAIVGGTAKHQHPSFDLGSTPTPGIGQWYDIGVLQLAAPIGDVPYAILPSPDEALALAAGADVEIVGYGLTSTTGFDVGVKHHGVADLVEAGAYELLIAEPGQQQNCNGDSGGPAFVDLDGAQRLVGVVSRSPDDNAVCDHGGVDTRVDPYLEWIHSVAALPCGTGLSEACPVPDAGPDPDGGGPGADDGDGGCGCRAGAGAGSSAAALAVAAALAARRRRRR